MKTGPYQVLACPQCGVFASPPPDWFPVDGKTGPESRKSHVCQHCNGVFDAIRCADGQIESVKPTW